MYFWTIKLYFNDNLSSCSTSQIRHLNRNVSQILAAVLINILDSIFCTVNANAHRCHMRF